MPMEEDEEQEENLETAVVLHEDKKYYPTAEEVYGKVGPKNRCVVPAARLSQDCRPACCHAHFAAQPQKCVAWWAV